MIIVDLIGVVFVVLLGLVCVVNAFHSVKKNWGARHFIETVAFAFICFFIAGDLINKISIA